MSRLLEIIRLFCRISSLLLGSLAKETYHFKEPTNRSHLMQVDIGPSKEEQHEQCICTTRFVGNSEEHRLLFCEYTGR